MNSPSPLSRFAGYESEAWSLAIQVARFTGGDPAEILQRASEAAETGGGFLLDILRGMAKLEQRAQHGKEIAS